MHKIMKGGSLFPTRGAVFVKEEKKQQQLEVCL